MAKLALNEFNIIFCLLRKVIVIFDASDVAVPALEGFENRFCFFENTSCREILYYFAVNIISCANLDFVKI